MKAAGRHVLLILLVACVSSARAGETAPDGPPVAPDGVSDLLATVPRLERWAPSRIEAEWGRIRDINDPVAQAREIERIGLRRVICDGLVRLEAPPGAEPLPFGFRDQIRDRRYARPTVVQVLRDALSDLREERPDAFVSLGDLAQPGCGQVSHGELIALVQDSGPEGGEATDLLNRSKLVHGVPAFYELRAAGSFPGEEDRYDSPDELVLVETRALGYAHVGGDGGPLMLRVGRRRFRSTDDPDEAAVEAALADAASIARAGIRLEREEVRSWDPEGGDRTLWRHHWIVPARHRQLELFSDKAFDRRIRPADLEHIVEMRFSRWQAGKPDSSPGQERWYARPGGVPGQPRRWVRWNMLYEAGHRTHISGLDADVSYVTVGNEGHFAVAVENIDAAATWRWFELLFENGERLGAPLDRIIVAPTVYRHLARNLPKAVRSSRIWRHYLVRLADHDAHHHVRFREPRPGADEAALRALGVSVSESSDQAGSPP